MQTELHMAQTQLQAGHGEVKSYAQNACTVSKINRQSIQMKRHKPIIFARVAFIREEMYT